MSESDAIIRITLLLTGVITAGILAGCTVNFYPPTVSTTPASPSQPAAKSQANTQAPVDQAGAAQLSSQLSGQLSGQSSSQSSSLALTQARPPENVLSLYTSSRGRETTEVLAGDPVELNVRTAVDAYVSCYYRQAGGDILRLYPNHHSPIRQQLAGELVQIPDSGKFEILASAGEQNEAFMCLAASENLENNLPSGIKDVGFGAVAISDFDALYALYRNSTSGALVAQVYALAVR